MMPEAEREVSHEIDEDGPVWDEGRDLPGEADYADLMDDVEEEGE